MHHKYDMETSPYNIWFYCKSLFDGRTFYYKVQELFILLHMKLYNSVVTDIYFLISDIKNAMNRNKDIILKRGTRYCKIIKWLERNIGNWGKWTQNNKMNAIIKKYWRNKDKKK